MHSKRGNEVAFSSHYKSLKVELPEVDLSSKTKCLWSLERKKLVSHQLEWNKSHHPSLKVEVNHPSHQGHKVLTVQSWSQLTNDEEGTHLVVKSSRHTKFVWSSQMVTSIVVWSTSTQPWSIQTPSLPYTWCTILFLHTHVGRAHVSWQVFAASCGSPWPLGVGPFHASPWPVSSNCFLKTFSTMQKRLAF